jgi:hypothetical protein
MESFAFNPHDYGDVCSELLAREILPPLGPGHPDPAAQDQLQAVTPEQLFGDVPLRDAQMGSCCLAGLWLWFGHLDASHQISQRIPTASGSYWHAMMHRREPDYSNAKYWFRTVGDHVIYDSLAIVASDLIGATNAVQIHQVLTEEAKWDAFRFVDLCQLHADTGSPAETVCRRIARAEWQLLFDDCYRRATK